MSAKGNVEIYKLLHFFAGRTGFRVTAIMWPGNIEKRLIIHVGLFIYLFIKIYLYREYTY